jgi:hypothetical protein
MYEVNENRACRCRFSRVVMIKHTGDFVSFTNYTHNPPKTFKIYVPGTERGAAAALWYLEQGPAAGAMALRCFLHASIKSLKHATCFMRSTHDTHSISFAHAPRIYAGITQFRIKLRVMHIIASFTQAACFTHDRHHTHE